MKGRRKGREGHRKGTEEFPINGNGHLTRELKQVVKKFKSRSENPVLALFVSPSAGPRPRKVDGVSVRPCAGIRRGIVRLQYWVPKKPAT